jgi:hypothetical protein
MKPGAYTKGTLRPKTCHELQDEPEVKMVIRLAAVVTACVFSAALIVWGSL